ncbi:unnamed protein product [Eruca vesicaria subsp. sativa]|uniref:MSP domain-containing protein n=1 Tax=Eruca vesicaria subsp. sativa TaxID=29727 RepID=A0ABC8L3G0_ERUVS|nr:unnamed protein product [Eruca vesicaria subsp. sativa]
MDRLNHNSLNGKSITGAEDLDVVISAPFPFKNQKPQSVTVGDTSYDSFTIKNTTDEAVDLWTKIYVSNPEDSFTLSILKPPSKDSDVKDIGLHTNVISVDWGCDNVEHVVFLLAEDKI